MEPFFFSSLFKSGRVLKGGLRKRIRLFGERFFGRGFLFVRQFFLILRQQKGDSSTFLFSGERRVSLC